MTHRLDPMTRSEAETWEWRATLLNPDGGAVDLDNATAIQWAISSTPQGPAIMTAGIGTGINIVDANLGRADGKVHPTQHVLVVARAEPYFHQLRVVMSDGTVYIEFEGELYVVDSPFPPPP